MRTAVDSNVLLDVLDPDPTFRDASLAALEQASAEGGVVACDIAWAEAGGQFDAAEDFAGVMSRTGVEFVPMSPRAAHAAGRAWIEYRRHGGKRERVIADFMIAAHALHHADRLLTRDRGYYRTYFPRLRVWQPG